MSIWTMCAGEPPAGEFSPFAQELHARWEAGKNAVTQRKVEDINSCRRLGAGYRHFSIPDCIYRCHPQSGEYMYASEAALNGTLHPGDAAVIRQLAKKLRGAQLRNATLVSPLALGNHVDHQLTRTAAQQSGSTSWYYADFPYVLNCKTQVEQLRSSGWYSHTFPISLEGLLAWQDAIAAHSSQISTFWSGETAMQQSVRDYLLESGGIRLWRKTAS